MRIGHRMKEILEVLEQAERPLKLKRMVELMKGRDENGRYKQVTDKDYATYSRAIRTLWEYGLVRPAPGMFNFMLTRSYVWAKVQKS